MASILTVVLAGFGQSRWLKETTSVSCHLIVVLSDVGRIQLHAVLSISISPSSYTVRPNSELLCDVTVLLSLHGLVPCGTLFQGLH